MHPGPAVFSSEPPPQQLQSPDLSAPKRGQFVQGASLTCSVLLLSLSSQHRDMDPGQMLFHRSLEVSPEIFLLTRWHCLQFSQAALEMWKDKLCWESASNFPKRYWSQLQSPEGVMVWEAVVTLLLQHCWVFLFLNSCKSFIYSSTACL